MNLFGASLNSKVAGILKRHARIRKYTVLSDIKLQYKKETIHIDHIYVGYFGILLIDCCDFKGSIYGNEKDPNWAYYEKDDKTAIKNPIIDLGEKLGVLRNIFASDKVYKLNYEHLVIIPADLKKLEVYVKSDSLLRVNDFKKHISKSKYDNDNGIKIETVVETIKKYQV